MLDSCQAEAEQRSRGRLSRALSVCTLLRSVADAFQYLSERCEAMSAEMERRLTQHGPQGASTAKSESLDLSLSRCSRTL